MKKIWIFCIIFLFMPAMAMAEMPLGEVPPLVTLQGDDGGRVDGTSWSSAELKGHVSYVFYVDPDESDLNDKMVKALETLDNPEGSYKSYAIINMDATWLPNVAIASKLKSTQKDHPDTIYVKDMEKILAKKWGLTDDTYDVLVIAKDGKVVFSKDGQLSESDIAKMLGVIRENVKK